MNGILYYMFSALVIAGVLLLHWLEEIAWFFSVFIIFHYCMFTMLLSERGLWWQGLLTECLDEAGRSREGCMDRHDV